MTSAARRTRLIIRCTAGIMGLAFGWLELNREDVGRALSGSSPEMLLRIALALYYLAWVMGTINDTNEQEHAYIIGPTRRTTAAGAITAAATLGLVFGALCWVNSARVFAVVLAAFLVTNFVWWRILAMRIIKGPITQSEQRYCEEGNFLGLVVLENMRHYIAGEWQWWRFGAGGVMVAAILVVALAGIPESLSNHPVFGNRDRTLGMMMLAYVVGFEFWIWFERLKLNLARRTLMSLGSRYHLTIR